MKHNNNLYYLRLSRFLTQKEFAQKVGLNVGVYSRYERGENDIPLSVAAKIARAFDVTIDFIADCSHSERGFAVRCRSGSGLLPGTRGSCRKPVAISFRGGFFRSCTPVQ